jgi:putative endonuclease
MRDVDPERLRRYQQGHIAEWISAATLMVKGYRILARRYRSRYGEIDLIAVRGKRIAFVEVKRRTTHEEALAALEGEQSHRIANAADAWIVKNPTYANYDYGFDALIIMPWRWPLHLVDGLRD